MQDTPYRLGLDLGTNSIGWCALTLDTDGRPDGVLDAGVRILTPNDEAGRDPKSKASLAANRRVARSARKRRDRFLMRQKTLMRALIRAGLMPETETERKALEKLDPYWLRATGLDQELSLHELGRAIFHLNQRRGFKSNRIADGTEPEDGAMKQGIDKLETALKAENARTLGEFLSRRHQRDRTGHRMTDTPQPVRFRSTTQGSKLLYELYPQREMILHEFDTLWRKQSEFHPALTDALKDTLSAIIAFQRPLKKPLVGRCTLCPETQIDARFGFEIDLGERAPKAHPLFQRFRILQDVSQLRVLSNAQAGRTLTLAEYKAICALLMTSTSSTVSFEKMRKAAKLPEDSRFNYELEDKKGFPPDLTAAKLAHRKAFGKPWRNLPRTQQIEIIERILTVEDEDALLDWLMETHNCSLEQAGFISAIRLPQGHGQFGRHTLDALVEIMERNDDSTHPETGEVLSPPLRYDEAVAVLDRHHSKLGDRATHDRLPYYGSVMARHVIAKPGAPEGSQEAIGRVPNPTVHIGLNQLRKLINALIDTYGPPQEIVVELARELKLSKKRKDEVNKTNRENQKQNELIRDELSKLGQPDTYGNRLKMRLFLNLPGEERVCVYSNDVIDLDTLFSQVEIDHILPYSRSLDDSYSNKVLCTTHANRRKGNAAPGERWSGDELDEIVARAERLFPRKAWRFRADAMKTFEEKGGFQARHLHDTQHMSRLAREYLERVCDRVSVTPGRMTAMLRAKWGLNGLLPDHNQVDTNQPKNRKDHRHHAIDGFVLACTNPGLLQAISRASGQAEAQGLERLFAKDSFPQPFEGYRQALQARLDSLIVSHKPDHGIPPGAHGQSASTSGRLLEDTAYGPADDLIDGKHYNLVTRKSLTDLSAAEIGRVRDTRIREQLELVLQTAKQSGEKLDQALARFGDETGIRRVRVLKAEKSVRTITHGQDYTKSYSPGDNHRLEIFELPDGEWNGEGITVFDANQPGFSPHWRTANPQARLIMTVHNGDCLEADFGDGKTVYRVYRLEPSAKRLRLAPHNAAGSIDKRHSDETDPLRWTFGSYTKLKAAGAKRVRIDELGQLHTIRTG